MCTRGKRVETSSLYASNTCSFGDPATFIMEGHPRTVFKDLQRDLKLDRTILAALAPKDTIIRGRRITRLERNRERERYQHPWSWALDISLKGETLDERVRRYFDRFQEDWSRQSIIRTQWLALLGPLRKACPR